MLSHLSIDERVKSCQLIVVTQQKFRTYYEKNDAPTRKPIGRIVAELKKMVLLETKHYETNVRMNEISMYCVTLAITTRLKHLLKRIQD